MDGTIADLDAELCRRLWDRGAGGLVLRVRGRSEFEYDGAFDAEACKFVAERDAQLPDAKYASSVWLERARSSASLDRVAKILMSEQGFYESLSPMHGCVEAIRWLATQGWEVFFCTSPLNQYRFCVPEKYAWIERHFGKDWVRRIIVTKDKTLVRGDFLIDDKPQVTGIARPSWYRIIYDQTYNRTIPGLRLKGWLDKIALLKLLEQHCPPHNL
jgi:5'(3')-deoxyribonucleotidase